MSIDPFSNYARTQAVPDLTLLSTAGRALPAATVPSRAAAPVKAAAEIATSNTPAQNAKLDSAVAAINDFLKPVANSLEFSVDEDSGRTIVKVVDTDTNDVVRQFPSKETLALSKALDKLQGLLLRDKA